MRQSLINVVCALGFAAAPIIALAQAPAAAPAPGAPAAAQAPGAPGAPGAGGPGGRGGRGGGRGPARMPQGGRGPIKVLVITKGHEFEREPFAQMLDSMGNDITWTHAEHPAADKLMNPTDAKDYDVYLFYDLGGPGVVTTKPDGTRERVYPEPSPQLKKDFEAMVKAGKGMVFLHHAAAAWAHHWPEYSEVIGGACDWYAPVTVRGITDPGHGFYGNTHQHITVVDKTSPIVAGLGDGFDVVDEAYSCAFFEDSVHPLLRTDFVPTNLAQKLNPARKYSNLSGWYKASENSPVVYIQIGHDHQPWELPTYRMLVDNAIKWAASPEALAWAKANHTTIWK